MALTREQQIQAIEKDCADPPRWKGIKHGYSAEDVVNLRGSLQPVYTLAQSGDDKLWELLSIAIPKKATSTALAP